MQCIPVPGKIRRGEYLGSIRGIVPTLVGDLHGCSFRDRCPYAFEACATTDIALDAVGRGRAYRCLLPADREGRREPAREAVLQERRGQVFTAR